MNNHITQLENLSLTSKWLEVIHSWDSKSSIGHKIGARIVGFMSTPFTCLIDAVFQTTVCAGKIGKAIAVSPIELLNFELASALVHLAKATESLFLTVILPFMSLLSPTVTHNFINDKKIQPVQNKPPIIITHNQEKSFSRMNKLKKENITLKQEIEQLKHETETLKKDNLRIVSLSAKIKQLKREIKINSHASKKFNVVDSPVTLKPPLILPGRLPSTSSIPLTSLPASNPSSPSIVTLKSPPSQSTPSTFSTISASSSSSIDVYTPSHYYSTSISAPLTPVTPSSHLISSSSPLPTPPPLPARILPSVATSLPNHTSSATEENFTQQLLTRCQQINLKKSDVNPIISPEPKPSETIYTEPQTTTLNKSLLGTLYDEGLNKMKIIDKNSEGSTPDDDANAWDTLPTQEEMDEIYRVISSNSKNNSKIEKVPSPANAAISSSINAVANAVSVPSQNKEDAAQEKIINDLIDSHILPRHQDFFRNGLINQQACSKFINDTLVIIEKTKELAGFDEVEKVDGNINFAHGNVMHKSFLAKASTINPITALMLLEYYNTAVDIARKYRTLKFPSHE